MTRRYAYFILIFVLFATALIIPETRRIMSLQVLCVAKRCSYPGYFVDLPVREGKGKQSNDLLGYWTAQNPPGIAKWQKSLALSQLQPVLYRYSHNVEKPTSMPSGYVREAMTGASDNPEVYACAIIAATQEGEWSYYRREDSELYGEPPSIPEEVLMNPAMNRKMIGFARSGERVDPDNAFFYLTEAWALFGVRRDGEALAAMHKAAGSKYFNSYRSEGALELANYLQAVGMPAAEAYTTAASGANYSHLIFNRHDCRLAAWYVKGFLASGETDRARELTADIIGISTLIRKSTTLAIERQSGYALPLDLAYIRPLPNSEKHMMLAKETSRREPAQIRIISTDLHDLGWTSIADKWDRGWPDSLDLLVFSKLYKAITEKLNSVVWLLAVTQMSYLALSLALILFIIAVVFRQIPRAVNKCVSMGIPGKTGLAILTLIPWAAASISSSFVYFMQMEYEGMGLNKDSFPYSNILPLSLLLFVFWSCAFMFQLLNMPGRGERGRGLRLILLSPSAVVALFSMLATVWSAQVSFTDSDRVFFLTGERPFAGANPFFALLLGIGGATMLVCLVSLIALIVRQIFFKQRRIGTLRFALSAIGLFLFPIGLGFLYKISIDGTYTLPTHAILFGLVFLAFVYGRTMVLRRTTSVAQDGASVMDTVRQCALVLAKVLVVVYFVLLIGQLPYRAKVTRDTHALIVNEVKYFAGHKGD